MRLTSKDRQQWDALRRAAGFEGRAAVAEFLCLHVNSIGHKERVGDRLYCEWLKERAKSRGTV